MAVVDVFNVGCAQLVAEVVDFTLAVVGCYDVAFLHVLYVIEDFQHGFDRFLHIAEHEVDIGIDFLVEMHVALLLAQQDFAYAKH